MLDEVGLGYLRLGQPLNTLSGGESQRLKLVGHLSDASGTRNLFIFDEPTTGLHFDDVAMLLQLFQRLVDRGHSLVVIEHNLEVIKSADWIVDLGPEAGDAGGEVVATGTPEQIAQAENSHTGKFLREGSGERAALLRLARTTRRDLYADDDDEICVARSRRAVRQDGRTVRAQRRALPNPQDATARFMFTARASTISKTSI